MSKSNRAPYIVIALCILTMFAVGFFIAVSKPVHAEGATFITVFRQASKHGVDIYYVGTSSFPYHTGFIALTDIGTDFVCGKNGAYLQCIPLDKITHVDIADTDTLP